MNKEVNEERTPRTVEDVKEMLIKHSNGEIQRTIQNCITILQNDHVLADAIRLNLLSERIDIVKPVGWPRSGKTLNDTDMKYILRRMEKYGISSEKKIESAIRIVANENRYHPIRDYLNGLQWDGTKRIPHVLHHFLGAAEDEYTCEAMKLFLLGAIKRVFQPGCKFETMLCLVGGQGAGKSTFFRLLADKDEWFSDDLRRLDDDNVYRKLQGHWIIEMSEMIATANAKSIEEIKSFLSKQKETYKVPYETHPADRLRQCVFAVTGQKILPVGRASKDALAQTVGRMGLVGGFIGLLLLAEKALDLLDALGIGSGDHLRHFDDPVALQLSVHVVIVQPPQVVREPLVLDGQQPEESGLPRALTAHQTEHGFKFTSRLEHALNGSQQENFHSFASVLVLRSTEKMVQNVGYPLCSIPF